MSRLTPPRPGPAKRLVARAFGAAAHTYDGVAALQRHAGSRLLESAGSFLQPGARILDAGAGTGFFASQFEAGVPGTRVVAIDLSLEMLQVARDRFRGECLKGDLEELPFRDGVFDLIFTNMAIQWCDPLRVFREFHRVLRPGGRLLLSSLGPATLVELKRAWAVVDDCAHVNEFVSIQALQKALAASGFTEINLDSDPRELVYPGAIELMRELKALGAHNILPGRPRYLMGKSALKTMVAAYPAGSVGREQTVSASFEVILGAAIAGRGSRV